ncbi:hypothetical protein RJ639_020567 [Escallonia herrerae]|uniref:BSD2 cysteine rich domain-containing protein n=1 Tax=Escallonia herrerae TaxID=1293975 RepID=A0AA88V3Y7_9ASTE|nr:hypothetical protein RJ639_020567 [Escallonia herrerae]
MSNSLCYTSFTSFKAPTKPDNSIKAKSDNEKLLGGKREILCGDCNGAGFVGGFMSTFDE